MEFKIHILFTPPNQRAIFYSYFEIVLHNVPSAMSSQLDLSINRIRDWHNVFHVELLSIVPTRTI